MEDTFKKITRYSPLESKPVFTLFVLVYGFYRIVLFLFFLLLRIHRYTEKKHLLHEQLVLNNPIIISDKSCTSKNKVLITVDKQPAETESATYAD